MDLQSYLQKKVNDFLEPLKTRTIPGIGNKTEKRFSEMGLETIKDLKKCRYFFFKQRIWKKKWNIHFQCGERT